MNRFVYAELDLLSPRVKELMLNAKIVKSKTEWQNLVKQNSIDIVGITVKLKVGKHRFIEIS